MSKGKDPLKQIAGHFQSVMGEISDGLKEREIDVFEALSRLAQPKGKQAIQKIVNIISELFEPDLSKLKFLKLVTHAIPITTNEVPKPTFWRTDSRPKLYFWDNFTKWILSEIPDSIPAYTGSIRKTQLTQSMYDGDILAELGDPTPFSVSEFAAIVWCLLREQPKGQEGVLLTNSYANIFYVQLKNGNVVTVRVDWGSDDREWSFNAFDIDDGHWIGGYCVFSRN